MERTREFISELFKGNTRNNYLHELRKGMSIICEEPVRPEPLFELFDATKPFAHGSNSNTSVASEDIYEWCFCNVRLPRLDKIDWKLAASFVGSLSSLKDICSFDAVYEDGEVSFFLGSSHKHSLEALSHLFRKFYPGAVILPCTDPIKEFETEHFFTLACHSYHQKVIFTSSLYEQLSNQCRMQVLFTPVKNNWHANIKEMLKAGKFTSSSSSSGKDVSKPLFAVSVRIGCIDKQALDALSSLFGSFIQAGKPLTKVYGNQYLNEAGEDVNSMFRKRISYATGMILTPDELCGFIHIPINVNTDFIKVFSVPEFLKHGRPIGMNNYSTPTKVCLPNSEEFRSVWFLGRSRAGKSLNMMHQIVHIATNEVDSAIYLPDCHRTTAQKVISLLPENMIERVIYLDHEDPDYIVKFNPCDEDDPALYGVRALDVVNSLEHIFGSESFHRMNHLLGMAILSLFVLKRNLSTIPILFSGSTEGDVLRKRVVAETTNAELKRFWRSEYANYSPEAFTPILNRLSALFLDERVLQMFSQTENAVRINDCWDRGNIIIEPLPVTTKLADTIGSMRLGQCRNAAFPRIKKGRAHQNLYLFCEEFHRYKCTGSDLINSIVNETAKTGLHFCASNQTTQQLGEGLLETVSSMRNILLFGMNTFDARRMKDLFNGEVSVNDLVSLPIGGCIAKISGETIDFQGFPPVKGNPETAKKIIEYSRKHYYTPLRKLKKRKTRRRELDHF